MATPKKKVSHTRSSRRYSTYAKLLQKKITNKMNLVKCTKCGEMRLSHHACPKCGYYRGRKVLDIKTKGDNIKKIKA